MDLNTPDGTLHTLDFVATRVGKLVTLEWGGLLVTSTTATKFISTVGDPLPAKWRPTVGKVYIFTVLDNSLPVIGRVEITSIGGFQVSVGANDSNFTNTGLARINAGSVSYSTS